MAVTVRNIDALRSTEAVTQLNKLRADLFPSTKVFHADASTAVSVALAADLPTVIARANALKAAYVAHIASAVSATTGQGVHIAADATNTISSPDATDQTSANTLLNELKADLNLHRASTTFHAVADATNVVASANATDLATSITLVNEIFTRLNAHFAGAMQMQAILLVAP